MQMTLVAAVSVTGATSIVMCEVYMASDELADCNLGNAAGLNMS